MHYRRNLGGYKSYTGSFCRQRQDRKRPQGKDRCNSKKEETRKAAYKDLIHYAGLVCEYAEDSIVSLSLLKGNTDTDTLHAVALRNRIEKALVLLKRVIDQTERRVFKG